jgi:hypothetical protein
MKLSPGTTGAVAELRVACYLISLGWDVFRSLSPNGSTDLVAIRGRRVLRIQVKSTLSLSQSKNLRQGRNHLLGVLANGELHFRALTKDVAVLIPGCTLARKQPRK